MKGVTSKLKETFYAEASSRWTYLNSIEINGTDYSDCGLGNLIYTTSSGVTLNLTGMGE